MKKPVPLFLPDLPDFSGLRQMFAGFQRLAERWNTGFLTALAPVQEAFRELGRHAAVASAIEAAGWLPHASTPYELLNADQSPAEIDQILSSYYLDHWPEAEAEFLTNVMRYSVDEETRATFTEGLAAHRSGLYRVTPRLLFPEIERVTRAKIHGGEQTPITSQKTLQTEAGHLGLSELSPQGMYGLGLYRKLISHLYAKTETEAQQAAAAADPVPNRHASLHGIVSYTTAKSSLNMLIMFDFILGAITAIQTNKAIETATEPGLDAHPSVAG